MVMLCKNNIKGIFVFKFDFLRVFFDEYLQRNLPIAIAQASIFCLYACYLYYFLPCKIIDFVFFFLFNSIGNEYLDVHVISFYFIGLLICTYFSWSNYYLAQKCDPGYISTNRDQQNRVKINLKLINKKFSSCSFFFER
jgi:hypothetical protein